MVSAPLPPGGIPLGKLGDQRKGYKYASENGESNYDLTLYSTIHDDQRLTVLEAVSSQTRATRAQSVPGMLRLYKTNDLSTARGASHYGQKRGAMK